MQRVEGLVFAAVGRHPRLWLPLGEVRFFMEWKKEAVEKLVNYHLDNGLKGFYVCGATGECNVLPAKTRKQMLETVIEANKGSGALITAQNALVQGRDLYALPANVGSDNSDGTNALLRDGATLVLEANDILRKYDFLYAEVIDRMRRSPSPYAGLGCDDMLQRMNMLSHDHVHRSRVTRPAPGPAPKAAPVVRDEPVHTTPDALATLDEKHKAVWEAIPMDRAVSMDKLMRGGYAIHELLPILVDLEVKGLINALPGGLYIRR